MLQILVLSAIMRETDLNVRPEREGRSLVLVSNPALNTVSLWLVSELFEEQFAAVLPPQDLSAGQLAGADDFTAGGGRRPQDFPDPGASPGLQDLVLLGQLRQEVLVLQDVGVGVEGREGVEEEGGELGGEAGTEGSLLHVGNRQAETELGGGDVLAGDVAGDVVTPAVTGITQLQTDRRDVT